VRRGWALFAPLIVLCTACSFLLNVQTEQCATSTDCAFLGAGYTCTEGTCVAPAVGGVDAGADTGETGPVACTSNAACSDQNAGAPFACDKASGQCVPLRSGPCTHVFPEADARNDNAVFFGVFVALTEVNAPLLQPVYLAYSLALQELQKAGGLPGGVGSPRRPLVAVFCDAKPTEIDRGVTHLIDTVRVPAVITQFSQTDMARVFQDFMLQKNVFALNPQDTTESLKRINANRLLWHLLGTPDDIAVAYRPLFTRVETRVNQQRAGDGGLPPLRVAMVTGADLVEQSVSAVVRDSVGDKGIVFNGKTTNGNGDDFLHIPLPALETSFGSYATQVQDFRPDVVVLMTGGETGPLATTLENGWAARTGGAPYPFYVLGPRSAQSPELLQYMSNETLQPSDTKRRRFVGIQYASAVDQTQKNLFLGRFKDAFPGVEEARSRDVENYYDAIYWIAYGAQAAGPTTRLTGPDFANGVRKLLSGPVVHPGTIATIGDALLAISSSSTGVTFEGALGTPDFDIASGAQRSVGAVYCYVKEGASMVPRYDQGRYNRANGTLEGNFSCFVGL